MNILYFKAGNDVFLKKLCGKGVQQDFNVGYVVGVMNVIGIAVADTMRIAIIFRGRLRFYSRIGFLQGDFRGILLVDGIAGRI